MTEPPLRPRSKTAGVVRDEATASPKLLLPFNRKGYNDECSLGRLMSC